MLILHAGSSGWFIRLVVRPVLLSSLCLACVSCGMMPWSNKGSDSSSQFQRDPITASYRSDPQLNLYQGKSHSLVVCLYQLKDPNSFNQLADDKEGIYKLMDCGRYDGSVAYAKRQIVQPGVDVSSVMDTAEGARYFGVVAGYYDLNRKSSVRLLQVESKWFGNPVLEMLFGPQEIRNAKVR